MKNLDLVVQHYKRISTEELVLIASSPSSLEIEIIPYLQSELLTRGQKEEALLLSQYLIQSTEIKKTYQDYTKEELNKIIADRIDSGEPLESIKIDLKENGIDIFKTLETEQIIENKKMEYLSSLRNENFEEKEIEEKMKSTFGVSETETNQLKIQLRKKGRQNIIFGTSLVVIMSLLTLGAFAAGGSVGIAGILLIGVGVWKISEGKRQKK
jgi:hypothetical protein